MKEWIRQAFESAEERASDEEYKAYEDAIGNDTDTLLMSVAIRVGIERMEDLCGVELTSGQKETLAEFISALSMYSFHLGYHKGMEAMR